MDVYHSACHFHPCQRQTRDAACRSLGTAIGEDSGAWKEEHCWPISGDDPEDLGEAPW
jgi:hypothetical protein